MTVETNSITARTVNGDLRVTGNGRGGVVTVPIVSHTPANNGDLVVEATSNTTLTFKLKGTDGTVRTGTIALT